MFASFLFQNLPQNAIGTILRQNDFFHPLQLKLYLAHMFGPQENAMAETRLHFVTRDGKDIYRYGRTYRWWYSRSPMIFFEARISSITYAPYGQTSISRLSHYFCKKPPSDGPITSITMETRFLSLQDILKFKGTIPSSIPFKAVWQHNCETT